MRRQLQVSPLQRSGDGALICSGCAVAERPVARMRGLLGRSGLAPGEGLLLRPAPSIHTFFMRFPIDVVFLDWDLKVLAVTENVRPFRIASHRAARTVLELPAGEVARLRIEVGQQLQLTQHVSAAPRSAHERRKTRVVLASRDRRYSAVTSFLLARNGYHVEATREEHDLIGVVERAAPNLVVIDASADSHATMRAIAALQTLHQGVGILVVSDTVDELDLRGVRVLNKWSPFQRLHEVIDELLLEDVGSLQIAHESV
jgi:uncharacterized protein